MNKVILCIILIISLIIISLYTNFNKKDNFSLETSIPVLIGKKKVLVNTKNDSKLRENGLLVNGKSISSNICVDKSCIDKNRVRSIKNNPHYYGDKICIDQMPRTIELTFTYSKYTNVLSQQNRYLDRFRKIINKNFMLYFKNNFPRRFYNRIDAFNSVHDMRYIIYEARYNRGEYNSLRYIYNMFVQNPLDGFNFKNTVKLVKIFVLNIDYITSIGNTNNFSNKMYIVWKENLDKKHINLFHKTLVNFDKKGKFNVTYDYAHKDHGLCLNRADAKFLKNISNHLHGKLTQMKNRIYRSKPSCNWHGHRYMCGDWTGAYDDWRIGCYHGQVQYILHDGMSWWGGARWKEGDWFGDYW